MKYNILYNPTILTYNIDKYINKLRSKYSDNKNRYKYLYKICSGSSSKLYKAYDKNECQHVIIKKINKNNEWFNEIYMLYMLKNNNNIINIIDIYDSSLYIYIVFKYYCSDKDILKKIQNDIPYTEYKGKILLKKMLDCIKICHDSNISHLDIKFDNFIYSHYKSDVDYSIVLIDFGHSEILPKNKLKKHNTSYGTSYFLCPEGFKGYRSLFSDIWSFGICVYILLIGEYPFNGSSEDEYVHNLKSNRLRKNLLNNISDDAKDVIIKCLKHDPFDRPTVNELVNHNFFKHF